MVEELYEVVEQRYLDLHLVVETIDQKPHYPKTHLATENSREPITRVGYSVMEFR